MKKKLTELAKMKQTSCNTACTVFENKIVFTGGYNCYYYDKPFFKSVEAYKHYENKWTYLPNMYKW